MERGNGGGRRGNPDVKRMWRRIRPLVVFLLSLGICLGVLIAAANIAFEKLFAPVEVEDAYRVMRCHGETPEFIAAYFGDDSREQQLAAIARIVHDADSLDYLRFATERGIGAYDGGRLCREASRKWIGFALEMVLYSLSSRDWIFQYFS